MRTGSGTTNACMVYTNCEIDNVFIMQILPAMLRFLFYPCINYSFNVFHPSRPVLFNLRSTFVTGKIHTKNFESPLSFVYYRATLLLITSDLFPGLRMWKTQPNFKCLLISCSAFKNSGKSSVYSAIFMILSKRPFLAFQ